MESNENRFICDAMLGGLARWLRAAGYDTQYEYGIDDGILVKRAMAEGLILLSSDSRLFERIVVRDGLVRSLYIPQQLSKIQQLAFVLRELALPIIGGRCMNCGGQLMEVPKHLVAGEAPPLAYRNCERFWRCSRCGKLLWHGTHWDRVKHRLDEILAAP